MWQAESLPQYCQMFLYLKRYFFKFLFGENNLCMNKPIVLDGKKLSQKVLENVKKDVEKIILSEKRKPMLAVILVGENPASKIYVSNKEKIAKECNIDTNIIKLSENIENKDLENEIEKLNNNKNIDGILLQLPLPQKFDAKYFISKIDPKKDVDCLTRENQSKIFFEDASFFPCTPQGVLYLIDFAMMGGGEADMDNIKEADLSFKNALIIGRSFLVGRPLSLMLLKRNATVTIAHSKTKNLQELVKDKDIIISCVGKKNLITSQGVKDNAILIDVGINRLEDGKIVGDFDFNSFKEKKVFITPVPKGVGPMTIAMLFKNMVRE